MLFPNEGRICFEVTAQMTGEKLRLQMREKADFAFFSQIWMGDFVLLSFLPGGEEGFSRVVGHGDGSAGGVVKIFGLYLATIDEGEDKAVGKEGAKLFHKVEREAGTSGAIRVEIANAGVEADAFEGGAAIMDEQCVGERQKCIDRIKRRAAVSA